MKIFKPTSVFDEALSRIRYLFDEFPNVIVGFSGGKDSTVCFNLALQVAREKNRLPLKVLFLDQEAEWQATIDLVEKVMTHPDVRPLWYQIPMKIFNATSTTDQWLQCWEKGADWIRPQHEVSIKENVFGTDRFAELFTAIVKHDCPNEPVIYVSGVRCEETPARMIGLTGSALYKWITWGKILDKKRMHFTFYPLYDWSYSDVWKAIHVNGWDYCKIYDYMYMHGVPVYNMRVSNVHHETAVQSLFYLQEMERDTYSKIVERIAGVDTAGKMGKADYFISELPFMFATWKDYRDFLLSKLIQPDQQPLYRKKFDKMEQMYGKAAHPEQMHRQQVNTILANDYHFTKLTNWEKRPETWAYRQHLKGRNIDKYQTMIKKPATK